MKRTKNYDSKEKHKSMFHGYLSSAITSSFCHLSIAVSDSHCRTYCHCYGLSVYEHSTHSYTAHNKAPNREVVMMMRWYKIIIMESRRSSKLNLFIMSACLLPFMKNDFILARVSDSFMSHLWARVVSEPAHHMLQATQCIKVRRLLSYEGC